MSAVQATNKVTAATTVVLHTDQCLHDGIASTYCQPLSSKTQQMLFFLFCYCENKIKWVFYCYDELILKYGEKQSFRFWV